MKARMHVRRVVRMSELLALTLGVLVSTAQAELRLHATTAGDAQHPAPADAYERIETPAARGGGITFVDRHQPLITIKNDDIRAVVIRERRTAMNDAESLAEIRTGRGGSGPAYVELTFRLAPKSATALNRLLNARQGQMLGLRFDDRFLTLAIVRDSFDGDAFTTFVMDHDRTYVKSLLGPLREKITEE